MGPCLGTVGRPGGNSKSVVLVSPDDASYSIVSGERARLLLLLLPGGWERRGRPDHILLLTSSASPASNPLSPPLIEEQGGDQGVGGVMGMRRFFSFFTNFGNYRSGHGAQNRHRDPGRGTVTARVAEAALCFVLLKPDLPTNSSLTSPQQPIFGDYNGCRLVYCVAAGIPSIPMECGVPSKCWLVHFWTQALAPVKWLTGCREPAGLGSLGRKARPPGLPALSDLPMERKDRSEG
ncbi:unnamed protein product [Pleuronectes platessa]|uniref:Uncharacterized protein n=1 Tax=Pleuronectes platessa TaxID=8262 RepID=A0A9N7YVS6_PLEPL|nr:unnamed protein product [Pleuronectes platessa]